MSFKQSQVLPLIDVGTCLSLPKHELNQESPEVPALRAMSKFLWLGLRVFSFSSSPMHHNSRQEVGKPGLSTSQKTIWHFVTFLWTIKLSLIRMFHYQIPGPSGFSISCLSSLGTSLNTLGGRQPQRRQNRIARSPHLYVKTYRHSYHIRVLLSAVTVIPNLGAALQRIRHSRDGLVFTLEESITAGKNCIDSRVRRVWIDALSINKEDLGGLFEAGMLDLALQSQGSSYDWKKGEGSSPISCVVHPEEWQRPEDYAIWFPSDGSKWLLRQDTCSPRALFYVDTMLNSAWCTAARILAPSACNDIESKQK